MNYRHIFHAGSFADVLKHTVLLHTLKFMQRKSTPYCYIDTHAGEGYYPFSPEAQEGILKLRQNTYPLPEVQDYLQIVAGSHYPGSPMIAAHVSRENDRIILNEKHEATFLQLKKNCRAYKNIAIHQRDAYEFLPAMIPPKEQRGVVLIDPSFEDKNEMEHLQACLRKCAQRWAQGVYLIWLPIVGRSHYSAHDLTHAGFAKALTITFTVKEVSADIPGLIGSSLVMLNPPWQIEETLRPLIAYLWQVLHTDPKSSWQLEIHE